MTFTYAGDLSSDREKVRFYMQDTVGGSGPKPSGTNFTDEELAGLITNEGSWQRAVAACFEALASIWANRYDFTTEGQSFRRSSATDKFAKLAKEWRDEYGSSAGSVSTDSVTRVDAYSDDIESDPV
jgi:hypothetical protein